MQTTSSPEDLPDHNLLRWPMRDVTFSHFKNPTSTAKQYTAPWPEWIEVLTNHTERQEKWGPAIILGKVMNGCGSALKNLEELHALALDLDNISAEQLHLVEKALEPFEYAAYTTHSHSKDTIKVRFVLPVQEPYAPGHHPIAWAGLNQLIGNINDEQTKNANRLFYLPSCLPNAHKLAEHHKGRWISLADLPNISNTVLASTDENNLRFVALLRKKLRWVPKKEISESGINLRKAATDVLSAREYAKPGKRHTTNRDLGMWLAIRTLDDPLPPEAFRVVFGPSIANMQEKDPGCPGIDDLVNSYESALEKAKEIGEWERKAASRRQAKELADSEPMTEEELKKIAKIHKVSLFELQRRWIIQHRDTFYVLQPYGEYRGPFISSEVRTIVTECFARAPVILSESTKNGIHRFSPLELAEKYGTLAYRVVVDATMKVSTYDAKERIFYEAISPLRDLEPQECPEITKWIHIFAGEQAEKLLDWLACLPDLNKSLCALYLSGPKSTGKTLLVMALARLWTTGSPTPVNAIIKNFNEELARCMLVLGDEALPTRWEGAPITTKIRSIITEPTRSLNRKYRPTVDLRGYIRLILTANNPSLLTHEGVATSEDLAAIGERFLYIEAPKEAADLLKSYGGAEKNHEWISEDLFAKHVLWLAENRKVKASGRRFHVTGDISRMHRILMASSDWNSWAIEWIVNGLLDEYDKLKNSRETIGYVLIRDGRLYISPNAIVKGWSQYLKVERTDPDVRKVATALKSIAASPKPVQLRPHRFRYFEIDSKHLESWAEENAHCSAKEIREALAKSVGDEDSEKSNLIKGRFNKEEEAAPLN